MIEKEMLDSLEILIEFGLGLAGFAGIIVALAGDPRAWHGQERTRVFGLLYSALLASFASFLCLMLANYYSAEFSVRVTSGIFFIGGLFFFPKQVYRTFYVFRIVKANYSRSITLCFSFLALAILVTSGIATVGIRSFFFFYTSIVLTLLFSAITYVRMLLYRPAGATDKAQK